MTNPSQDFLQRLAAKRAEAGLSEHGHSLGPNFGKKVEPEVTHEPDLIPSIEAGYEVSPIDQEIQDVLDRVGIVDAYNKWCGKSKPNSTNRTEGIKVSCPNPPHADTNPSAWLNTDKGTWYCAACELGGDKYDIAAWRFGYNQATYKKDDFRALRIDMAVSLGYRVVSAPGISYLDDSNVPSAEASPDEAGAVAAPQDEPEDIPESPPRAEAVPEDVLPAAPVATVTSIYSDDDDDDNIILPHLDWRDLVQPDTFLSKWMEATHIDDIPDEYYFWNGMLAIGLALGRDTTLFDRRPVHGNLFVCIVGETGSGKSQSEGVLTKLMREALPYDHTDPMSTGIEIIAAPASGESMIWAFQKDIIDPTTGKPIGTAPIRGLMSYNELAALTGRASRAGNTMKSTLMDFYDCAAEVGTRSRMHGVTRAKAPFASLLTTTQPKSMGHLLSGQDVDAGFVNRFLFVTGAPKKRMAIGGAQISIDDCIKPIQRIRAWGGTTPQIQWSSVAEKSYTEFFHDIIEPAKKKNSTVSRLDLLTKKLILLFTANELSKEVEIHNVDRVRSMMDYILRSYGMTAEMIGNDQAWELREDIIRHLNANKAKGGITLRGLNDRLKRKKYPTNLVRRTIDDLVTLQLIEAIATKGVGRPTVKYAVVDS